ncbi:hypothetical protein PGT21_002636 [Puccinia graminis f. sp. tritici]|uniref:Uncharacterized protein n=2 Tax=Puccinia graminis f. sp. tritici TaxID=56615 RepID=A0A5B0MTK4_PUCGR|nr:hypothetical protein PGT21_002636 [Puccinia graminis f. sp. tritici]
MSHPLTRDPEWDNLQDNYDPLGYSPLTGRFSNPTLDDQPPISHGHIGQTYQPTIGSNPPAIPPRPTSHTGAIRNTGVRHMVPSMLPYSIDSRDLPPNDELLGAALDQSNTAMRRPSRSSASSSTANTSVSQTESLETIQRGLQAFQSSFRITEDLLQRAQPLLQMSQEARTTAILLLALQNNLGPPPNATPPVQSTPSESPVSAKGHKYSSGIKAYLRKNIRLVLLDKDIECYGHRNARRLQASVTPVTRVMSMINDETPEFRKANLPPNIPEADLEAFIADQVKTNGLTLPNP